jgi:hypothetical protein
MLECGRRDNAADSRRYDERASSQTREELGAAGPGRERGKGGVARDSRVELESPGRENQNGGPGPEPRHDAAEGGEAIGLVVGHEEEAPARESHRAQERVVRRDDPGISAPESGEERHHVRKTGVVGDHKERTVRWHSLAPGDDEAPGRVVDDQSRAFAHVGPAELAIVRDETSGDVIRERSHESAHHLDAYARGAADKRFGTFPCKDLCDLTAL